MTPVQKNRVLINAINLDLRMGNYKAAFRQAKRLRKTYMLASCANWTDLEKQYIKILARIQL